eukprot:1136842-Pelagomonas_calceolata.AAC.3
MAVDDSNDGPAEDAAGQGGRGGADSQGVGEGSSGGLAAGTESNPEGSISKEADSSFDVFRDDDVSVDVCLCGFCLRCKGLLDWHC